MRFGDFHVRLARDRPFRLDGGAMFGVVPKPLWERAKPADERNRIRMITHCLVVTRGDDVVVVDTGLGEKLDEKARDIFGVSEEDAALPEVLGELGIDPSDVTHVVLTHLHFDHCGWNTRRDGDGWVPTFPRATYWMGLGELEHARSPNPRDRASYDPRNWEPVIESGRVELFEDEAEPVPGLRAVRAPGHTRGMASIVVDGGSDGTLGFFSDLCPTAAHVPIPWVMGYDLYPVTTMETKSEWLERAAEESWVCIFQHDPETPVGRLVGERPGRYRAEPADDLSLA